MRPSGIWLMGARAPSELLVLSCSLALLLICSIPHRFPAVFYPYIPCSDLPAALLRREDSDLVCPAPRSDPRRVAVNISASAAFVTDLSASAHCRPLQQVALLVPYRARPQQLAVFLQHMRRFLAGQSGLQFRVYVVEQSQRRPFNRAKLLNVGFQEAVEDLQPDCVILHDVDLLPEDLGNVYACTDEPRHLSAQVNTLRYMLMYREQTGGVLAITPRLFRSVNGLSNRFFGWGGEDDDLWQRLARRGVTVTRPDPRVSRYTMLPHVKAKASEDRYNLLKSSSLPTSDGLADLSYRVLHRQNTNFYRRIVVEL